MLKYAYELGAAAAIEDFTKEAWPQWLKSLLGSEEVGGLLGSGLSKAIGTEGTRRDLLRRPLTKAVGHAVTQLPKAVGGAAAVGAGLTAAQRVGKAAVEAAPDMTRRGFLKTVGAAGAAGAAATTGHVAAKLEPAAGNAIDSFNNLGSVISGDFANSSPLARRLRMFSEAKRLANTPVSQLTSETAMDASKLLRDAMLTAGPASVVDTAVGGSKRFGLNVPNFLPGVT